MFDELESRIAVVIVADIDRDGAVATEARIRQENGHAEARRFDVAEPEEIRRFAEDSAFTTGSVLECDGGITLGY